MKILKRRWWLAAAAALAVAAPAALAAVGSTGSCSRLRHRTCAASAATHPAGSASRSPGTGPRARC